MTPEFLRAAERTLKIEGGYVDNPFDRGGATNMGITFGTLTRWIEKKERRVATVEDLRTLTHRDALQLYFDLYWNDAVLPCQQIALWWEPMAGEAFDSAVLHGPRQSALFLQRTLNLLNRDQRLFPDLKIDGWAGKATMAAMKAMDRRARGKEALLLAVNIEQGAFLRNLAMNDPTQEEFYAGWILQRVQLSGGKG